MNPYVDPIPDNFPDFCVDTGSLVFSHWLVINFALADNRFGDFARKIDLNRESLRSLNSRECTMGFDELKTFRKLKEMYNQYLWYFNLDGPHSTSAVNSNGKDPDYPIDMAESINFADC